MELPTLGTTLEGVVCLPEDDRAPPIERWTSPSGAVVDLADLRRLDAVAFKEERSALDPILADQLSRARLPATLPVDVWLALGEDALPMKDEMLAGLATAPQDQTSLIRAARADVLDAVASYNAGVAASSRIGVAADDTESAPRIRMFAPPAAVPWLGRLDGVWKVMPDPGPGAPSANFYFDVDVEAWLDDQGLDGTGRKVAILEGGRFDSTWNLGSVASGNCTPTDANNSSKFLCHCGTAPTNGSNDAHCRAVAGVVRNSVLSHGTDGVGGMADGVTFLSAPFGGTCTPNGPDTYASAIAWATSNGAKVINQSWGFSAGSPSSSNDMLLDYTATHTPYPFIVAAAGNSGAGTRPNVNIRNGLVVGGGADNGQATRAGVTMWAGSADVNFNGATGFEVPHLVAPAVGIDTAGDTLYEVETWTGTSFAAPQVSGMAASLMELNPNLSSHPELLMAGLLASADEDVDGTWPLFQNDGVDDKDGVGLVNAYTSWYILHPSSSYPSGNTTATNYGHAYGTATPAVFPAGTWYSSEWKAAVAAGQRLRVASTFFSTTTCGSPPTATNCSSNPYPTVGLYIYDGTTPMAGILNANNNYQYITNANTSGSAKTYRIRMYLSSWSGLSTAFWGLGWVSQ